MQNNNKNILKHAGKQTFLVTKINNKEINDYRYFRFWVNYSLNDK